MDEDWKELAERVRIAARGTSSEVTPSVEEQAARLDEGRRARGALLDDLVAFGEAVGVVTVSREGEEVVWSHAGRTVRFSPMGEGDRIKVDYRVWTPREGRLYREALLGDKWVLSVTHGANEDREPLFEKGLVRLIVEGLRLPDPREAKADAPTTRPADATPGGSEAPSGPRRTL